MDALRAGNPVVADGIALVPVERCVIQSDGGCGGCWLSASKEPFAVIVCDASGVRAFDAESTEVPVESLVERVPQLDRILAPWMR